MVEVVRKPRDHEDRWIGKRIGPWTIERLLGQGGMGKVYFARRTDGIFEQEVAIKLLRSGVDTHRFRERFERERRIVAALEHPGIARLLDGGETEDGVPYLVLEHVEGRDLLDHARSRELDVDGRVQLFLAALEAVAYAHRRLVVHRDLKPSNILVTADGAPKLLDFGIAKLLEPETGSAEKGAVAAATVTHERLLTPEYASPEQLRGEPVTTGVDVYALGVVLYELLAGERPHHKRSSSPAALSRAIEEEEPDRPSQALARSRRRRPGKGRGAARRPRRDRAQGAAQGSGRALRLGGRARGRPRALSLRVAGGRASGNVRLSRVAVRAALPGAAAGCRGGRGAVRIDRSPSTVCVCVPSATAPSAGSTRPASSPGRCCSRFTTRCATSTALRRRASSCSNAASPTSSACAPRPRAIRR